MSFYFDYIRNFGSCVVKGVAKGGPGVLVSPPFATLF